MKSRTYRLLRLIVVNAFIALFGFLVPHALAQLNADLLTEDNNHTIFMADYTCWWYHAFGAPYKLQDLSYTTISDYIGSNTTSNTEDYYLYNGEDPSPPSNNLSADYVTAVPSLYATGLPGSESTIAYGSNSAPSTSGYDSNDDTVITYHASLLANLQIQVVVPDLTNNMNVFSTSVSPTFSAVAAAASASDDQVTGINSWYDQYASSGDTAGSIQLRAYARLLTDLHTLSLTSGDPNLYVVPCIGGFSSDAFDTSSGDSEFEKALTFVLDGLSAYSDRSVTYQSAPLVLVFHANESNIQELIADADSQAAVIAGRGYSFTLRHVGALSQEFGYSSWKSVRDASESTWNQSAPRYLSAPDVPLIRLQDGLWSWTDMLYSNESGVADAFSSYSVVPSTAVPEFCSVSLKSGADYGDENQYDVPFLATRNGEQINAFMSAALPLKPKFIFVAPFNQYVNNDGGFSVDARGDFEPTVDSSGTVHFETYDYLYNAISGYNAHLAGTAAARFSDIRFRGQINQGSLNQLTMAFVLSNGGTGTASPQRIYAAAIGPSLASYMGSPSGITYASNPILSIENSANGNVMTNSGYEDSTTSVNSSDDDLIDSRNDRAFYNSPVYFNLLDFGETMSDSESAITADLSPDTYVATVVDGDNSTPSLPGLMTHVRLITSDSVSSNRVTNFSVRGYVSSSVGNQLVLGFTLDAAKTVYIAGAGPGLEPFLGSSGLLEYPEIQIYNSDNDVLYSNSGISSGELSTFQAKISWLTTGDSGLIETLPAGTYTVVLSNYSGSSSYDGVGLLTIYED